MTVNEVTARPAEQQNTPAAGLGEGQAQRDGLLANIREHPDDDAPLLVFADWRNENAQPRELAEEIVQLAVEDLRLHPALADIPQMRPEEWQPFLEDVREHGVREPLTVQVGQPYLVLDGRHRLEAAKEVELAIVPVRLVNLSESEQEEHVYVSALHRRHLTDDQRAVLTARCYVGQAQQARQDRARKGGQAGGRGRPKKDDSSQAGAAAELPGSKSGNGRKTSTRQRVAKEHGVPEKKLRNAIELEQEAPEVAQQVVDGESTLKQALQAVRGEELQVTTPAAAESEGVGPDTTLNETGGHEQPALDPCPQSLGLQEERQHRGGDDGDGQDGEPQPPGERPVPQPRHPDDPEGRGDEQDRGDGPGQEGRWRARTGRR
jgi:uncharacterized protein (TIGR02996 family)